MTFRMFFRYAFFLMVAMTSMILVTNFALAQTEPAKVAPGAKHIETWKGTLDLGIKLELETFSPKTLLVISDWISGITKK